MSYRRVVLNQSSGVTEDSHVIQWALALCLMLAWALLFGAIYKGIKSIGKVVHMLV